MLTNCIICSWKKVSNRNISYHNPQHMIKCLKIAIRSYHDLSIVMILYRGASGDSHQYWKHDMSNKLLLFGASLSRSVQLHMRATFWQTFQLVCICFLRHRNKYIFWNVGKANSQNLWITPKNPKSGLGNVGTAPAVTRSTSTCMIRYIPYSPSCGTLRN